MEVEGKELSAKEKKLAAKKAKAARRAQKVDAKGGPTEGPPEVKKGGDGEGNKKVQKDQKKDQKPKENKSQTKKISEEKNERKLSDREKENRKPDTRKHLTTRATASQADLSETLFTYMKNTVGVDDELDKMGFGLADPFQKKQNVEDQQKLHPSFVRLGVKSAHRINNEPTARAEVLMKAIKEFISDFHTTDLSSGTSRSSIGISFIDQLKPNLNFLTKCRPFIKSEACIIDHVKLHARRSESRNLEMGKFKEDLIEEIDSFWLNRVTTAQIIIKDKAKELIKDGNVVMTFGYSNSVYNIFSHTKFSEIDFSVVVVDCEPEFNGRKMVSKLEGLNIDVQYCTISGLSYMMEETDLIFLGAQSLLANGSVEMAKGGGIVALVGAEEQKPVLVCCETYKFNDRAAINALDNKNELGCSSDVDSSLQYANIIYDVIPPSLVTAAITEVGVIPSTSVATILTENDIKNKNYFDAR